jgi:hypothetical protein
MISTTRRRANEDEPTSLRYHRPSDKVIVITGASSPAARPATLPFAQPVDEVAGVIVDLIEHPRAEAHTRPEYRQRVAEYYGAEGVAVIESRPPLVRK